MIEIRPTWPLIRFIHFSILGVVMGVGLTATGVVGGDPGIGEEPLTGVGVVDGIDDEAVTNDAIDEQPMICWS
jgi:hypothetical protein